jgi:hypothetical protein
MTLLTFIASCTKQSNLESTSGGTQEKQSSSLGYHDKEK